MLESPTDESQVNHWFGLRDEGLLAGFLDGSVRKILRDNAAKDILNHFNILSQPTTKLRYGSQ